MKILRLKSEISYWNGYINALEIADHSVTNPELIRNRLEMAIENRDCRKKELLTIEAFQLFNKDLVDFIKEE